MDRSENSQPSNTAAPTLTNVLAVLAAVANNVVQVTLSVPFIFEPSSWVIAPPFLILGTAAGIVVGLIAERFCRSSRWVERLRKEDG